jgi:hypothetical protein
MKLPKYVIWDPRFTPKHPFFFCAFDPNTKKDVAKNILGIDLPDELNAINEPIGIQVEQRIYYIGSWEDFLRIATPKQIADVMECLELAAKGKIPEENRLRL